MPTDEQITRRLAEMMGWKIVEKEDNSQRPPHPRLVEQFIKSKDGCKWWLFEENSDRSFNPLRSHSDAHECMLAMPEEKRTDFINHLLKITLDNDLPKHWAWAVVTATPRQLCMAMYAAMEAQP